MKELGVKHGFAESFKIYKKDKESYKGHVGDVASIIRVSLTTSSQSPNLYAILHILTKEEINARFDKILELLK